MFTSIMYALNDGDMHPDNVCEGEPGTKLGWQKQQLK